MSSPLPHLYLDHSALAHEAWWPQLDAILASGRVRLALSLWNLVEIGIATNLEQRERRLAFLEHHKPLWIVERVGVQRQEVRRFLWNNHFRATHGDICVITPHLSIVDAHLAGASAQVGLTARSFIERTDFAGIERQKKLAPDALSSLQAVDRRTFKSRQDEVFKRWIENLIPTAGPDGKLLSSKEKAELLNYCYAHQDEFFAACPALAVEDALTAARTANPNRKPQISDGIDLMHAVIALAYCDYFLVRDGFLRTCAEQAIKALSPKSLARVYDDPAALANDLMPPAATAALGSAIPVR